MGRKANFVVYGSLVVLSGIGILTAVGRSVEEDFTSMSNDAAMSNDTVPTAGTTVAATADPAMPSQQQPPSTSETMTEKQRITLTTADPEMKAASDFVGALINVNGHLCAQVINVVPASDSNFEVTCIKYRNGNGRARYLVDGSTNSATPL